MCDVGGDGNSPVADLVTAMGKKRVSDLSVARNEVIKKGLVFAPERGLLAFTCPRDERVHRPAALSRP